MRRRPMLVALSATFVLLAIVAGVLTFRDAGSTRADATANPTSEDSTTPEALGPLSFRVDESLRPSVATVDPIGDTTRPVGVYAAAGRDPAELVLDEVMVHVADDAGLEAFLARWDGTVLDSFEPESDGSQDHLVRVDTSSADPDQLVDDLVAFEPDQGGEHRVSDERVLRLLALAAAEWRHGTELVLDWLGRPMGIEDGDVREQSSKNVFEWSYMEAGGPMATGVAEAWRLLDQSGRLTEDQTFLVGDGGFAWNPDFPRNVEIEHADLGDDNAKDCSGGSPCPWHGTDVILAGIGAVDNGYGVAGPGGPVAGSVVAVANRLDYWTQLRRLERHSERFHPSVVNLSFGREVDVGVAHAKTWTDRRMRHIGDTGALVVAAAGNAGKSVDSDTLFAPCESRHVLCVGGYDSGALRADGSNYGEGDSPTSVELWAPMCVETINDPSRPLEDRTTRRACGTSFSSPFVGGVAMLVKAADPSLTADEIRSILDRTAHVGGLGSEVTGSQRKVNALGAVAAALEMDVAAPTVAIDSLDSGDEFRVGEWIDLDGTAIDFAGRPLELSWSSDQDGHIATGNKAFTEDLSVGQHVITATATDVTGRTGETSVTIGVVDTPAEVKLVAPYEGFEVWIGSDVALVADTLDPDTWSPVPDDEVEWRVLEGGSTVFTGHGHKVLVPAASLSDGQFRVELRADGQTVERTFRVKTPPPGETPPVATITAPESGLVVHAYNGQPVAIQFSGHGTDTEDGLVAGTRSHWYAISGDERVELCRGSNVPGSGGGGGGELGLQQDCAEFEGELGLLPTDGQSTTWTVYLVVYDSAGLDSSPVEVDVEVQYVTG